MTFVRRNPLQSAIGALLAVGLLVSAVVATTGGLKAKNAVSCGSGYGYGYNPNATGYGYAPSCPGASGQFGEGTVFTVERGQSLKLSGTGGTPGQQGTYQLDFGNSTAAAASAHASSFPEPQ